MVPLGLSIAGIFVTVTAKEVCAHLRLVLPRTLGVGSKESMTELTSSPLRMRLSTLSVLVRSFALMQEVGGVRPPQETSVRGMASSFFEQELTTVLSRRARTSVTVMQRSLEFSEEIR
jgi:hypothetical protein